MAPFLGRGKFGERGKKGDFGVSRLKKAITSLAISNVRWEEQASIYFVLVSSFDRLLLEHKLLHRGGGIGCELAVTPSMQHFLFR